MSLIKILCCILMIEVTKGGYDYGPLVKMEDYDKDYRTLSCWECFRAEGRMCRYRNNKSMIHFTGSSNPGHGMCCKPGSAN